MFSVKNSIGVLFALYLFSCVCSQFRGGRRSGRKDQLTSAKPLTDEDHETHIKPLIQIGWAIDGNCSSLRMKKDFIFRSFFGAFGFMTHVAMHCEETNHFPEWFNVYKVVKITLTTKHIKSLSMHDVHLAHYIEQTYLTHRNV